MRNIPFHCSFIGEEEEQAVVKTLRTGWLTKGPQTVEFEDQFKKYVGTKYAVGLNSCTAGLHLALLALGIKKTDEVITTPLTFAATANVIVHCGAKVVFADVEESTGNICFEDILKKTTSKTKAIIVVHFAGHPCSMDKICQFAKHKKIHVIEDAAHALGAAFDGKKVGTWGKAAAFSFYATKNITTGEGGMLTTNCKKTAEKVGVLSLHGLSRNAWKRYAPGENVFYSLNDAGFKYNMFDLQAALGIEQLKRFDLFQEQREKNWNLYNHFLSGLACVELPSVQKNIIHARHLYIVKFDISKLSVSRNQIMELLRKKGIYTQVHFIPLHMQPFYKKRYSLKNSDFPVATQLAKTMVSLPFYPQLKKDDIEYVCNQIKDLVERNLKYTPAR